MTNQFTSQRVRVDIQALRTVAVLAVVLYHLWPNRLTGGYTGVDVFFVISGFLITSHIVRDAEMRSFSVTAFWARRLLRLLPASLLVLAVTAVGVWALAPMPLWTQWFREIAASTLYAQNWILAADTVDYMAAENVASPVQHYWSLSTEEQFYLVWPLLLALALGVGRYRRSGWRPTAVTTLALVTVLSAVTSMVWTSIDQPTAYLVTPTRAWEFGAGALLAFSPALRVWRTAAVWVGLVLIAVSAVAFTPGTPFPGMWAAVPVIGTALVIAGRTQNRATLGLMSVRPVQFLGDVSYAIYLWHWPLIVLVPFWTGHSLRTFDKVTILGATILLAWATRRWVEQPILTRRRKIRTWVTFTAAAVAGALVLALTLAGTYTATHRNENELRAAAGLVADPQACFGAAARPLDGQACAAEDLPSGLTPPLDVAPADTPALFHDRCDGTSKTDAIPKPCQVGDQDSPVRIALIGDSHAVQYSAMLDEIASRNGWALDGYSKGACPFSDVRREQDAVLHAACTEWVERATKMLIEGDYDLVLTSQVSGVAWSPPSGQSPDDYAEGGLVSLWTSLADVGIRVAAIADVPRPQKGVLDCLLKASGDVSTACRAPRTDAMLFDPQPGAVAQLARPDVTLIDMTDIYCDERECLPVIGGVPVYRDSNHLTNTFAGTLSPYFEAVLGPLLVDAT
ncbi:peptidoglycan/LPS O-acetylase OafA/YrhL [Promicromonospora sp. AC04]|uniref:acyltransferase family protein n=1 Tax=Promicromonospora sp. AC04 TaxID=2135723 RepID=UPI000D42815F|nr:acyltransferase family protein [Promicromonospora sp. AC04]PUB24346.1 peptidoglycan/LPS O-acetylase OafA/YrhL [Promicromonospora sp. AC04]